MVKIWGQPSDGGGVIDQNFAGLEPPVAPGIRKKNLLQGTPITTTCQKLLKKKLDQATPTHKFERPIISKKKPGYYDSYCCTHTLSGEEKTADFRLE